MSKNPKRHHTLSQFYLEGFTRDGYLWIYDRERRETRRQTAVNTAVRSHYYSYTGESGARNTEVEGLLSRVESEARPCVAKLRKGGQLSAHERERFAFFLALLRTRVPEFHALVQEMHEKSMKKMLQMTARHEGAIEHMLTQVPNEEGVTAAQLREFLERGEYRITIDRAASLAPMLQLAVGLAGALHAGNWLVMTAPASTSFVTSDNPVTGVWPEQDSVYPTPFMSPRVSKLVPVAYDTLLVVAGEGARQSQRQPGKAEVRELNIVVSMSSTSFVIARDEALLANMVSKCRLAVLPVRERVRVG